MFKPLTVSSLDLLPIDFVNWYTRIDLTSCLKTGGILAYDLVDRWGYVLVTAQLNKGAMGPIYYATVIVWKDGKAIYNSGPKDFMPLDFTIAKSPKEWKSLAPWVDIRRHAEKLFAQGLGRESKTRPADLLINERLGLHESRGADIAGEVFDQMVANDISGDQFGYASLLRSGNDPERVNAMRDNDRALWQKIGREIESRAISPRVQDLLSRSANKGVRTVFYKITGIDIRKANTAVATRAVADWMAGT